MKYRDLSKIKQAYLKGENIMKLLRDTYNCKNNTDNIIEISYDLQSGSYIELAKKNMDLKIKECNCMKNILTEHINENDIILDCGTGEMTTYTIVMSDLKFKRSYNFDLSLSRILKGTKFLKESSNRLFNKTKSFVSSIDSIPLADNSVDIGWTSHSLEPNRGKEEILIKEILRVCKNKLILFEPSYDRNSEEGKRRMLKLGYIQELEGIINNLEADLIDIKKIKTPQNPLNPTYAYIIKKNNLVNTKNINNEKYYSPGGDLELDIERSDCLISSKGLIGFPKVKNIPLLKNELAFIISHPELI